MIEKQFGVQYGPALTPLEKIAIKSQLREHIDQAGGAPYGWMRIYETLLFHFYNRNTGAAVRPSRKSVRCD
jgi:hypothetical protein